ncbi:MAG: hypothetical protein LGR52_07310 [Candidatus Thiosymbion ectosymbiont of Robbea hypermnestra]|nr:hypothetical protein [Candidatus Thiosymbion ectosymbiont of Robbea hypermnestra]
MKATAEMLALEQILTLCRGHDEALNDALVDLSRRELNARALDCLSKEDRRLLDQFAYRYTRLQDDMGARLIPALLGALGEDVAAMSALDRLDRLEQLAWLSSADEWSELRRIRNEFTHGYPETSRERYERLQLAILSASRLREILGVLTDKIGRRFDL